MPRFTPLPEPRDIPEGPTVTIRGTAPPTGTTGQPWMWETAPLHNPMPNNPFTEQAIQADRAIEVGAVHLRLREEERRRRVNDLVAAMNRGEITRDEAIIREREAQALANAAEGMLGNKPSVKERKVPTNIQEQYGIRPHKDIVKLMEQHKGEQIMGVELEIENFPVPLEEARATGIDFAPDGSLRNNGVEGITRPNHYKALTSIIKNMWEKYSVNEKNFSDRTSIHVHCNVLHFTSDQIKTLVILYSLMEEILFDFVGNDRRENIFCTPWCEAGIHMGNYHRVWTNARDWQKYTSLNLQPVSTQGTVEFRHMHGHADIDLLSNWLQIIKEIMHAAEHGNSEQIYKRVMDLNTTSEYGAFFHEIFPTTASILIKHSPTWEQHLVRGVIEAKLSTLN